MTEQERAEIVVLVKKELAEEAAHKKRAQSMINRVFADFKGEIASLENDRRRIEAAIRQLLRAAHPEVHSLERLTDKSESDIRDFVSTIVTMIGAMQKSGSEREERKK